jgi:hypothetical protein
MTTKRLERAVQALRLIPAHWRYDVRVPSILLTDTRPHVEMTVEATRAAFQHSLIALEAARASYLAAKR